MASEVHCIDCLRFIEEGGLKEALGDRKAVLVSDPPFNIGYHYSGYKDRMKEDDYYQWLAGIIRKAGIHAVIVHYPEALYRIAMSLGKAPERVAYGSMRLWTEPWKLPRNWMRMGTRSR